MKWLKLSTASSFGFAALFGLVSLVLYFGDWSRLFFVTSIGFFFGLLAAPEFDKKAFRTPRLFQAVSGSIAGAIIGAMINVNLISIVIGLFIGGILGWLASYWVKHVQIP